MSISPFHANRQLMSPARTAALLVALVSFLDVKTSEGAAATDARVVRARCAA